MTDLTTRTDTPTTTPADTAEVLPQLRMLAAAYRERQETAWEQARIEQLEAETRQVAEAAAGYVRTVFRHTLAKVLTQEHWQGYPALHPYHDGAHAEPCAVAHLGEGLFLRYVARSERYYDGAGHGHLMLLLAPCPCGNYLEIYLDGDDYDLAAELANADQRTNCHDACTPSGHHPYDEDDDADDQADVAGEG